MKRRILTLGIACALVTTAAFTGCNTKPKETTAASTPEHTEKMSTEAFSLEDDMISGGWSMYTDAEASEIPQKAKEAFEKAMEQLTGADYTVAAYLGSQIVSGTNYSFLCNCTLVTAKPTTTLKLVTVYEDLEGTATVSEVTDIDITAYTQEKELKFEQLSGGFQAEEAAGSKLPADAQTAFDKAMEGLTGVGYEPLALLATQVVAGSNYAILCKATSVTAEPTTTLAVVIVYADLESGAQIRSICPFAD